MASQLFLLLRFYYYRCYSNRVSYEGGTVFGAFLSRGVKWREVERETALFVIKSCSCPTLFSAFTASFTSQSVAGPCTLLSDMQSEWLVPALLDLYFQKRKR